MSRIFILIKLILNLLWKYVHTSSPMFIPFNFYCYYFKHKTQSDLKNSKAKKRLFLIYHTKKKKKKEEKYIPFLKDNQQKGLLETAEDWQQSSVSDCQSFISFSGSVNKQFLRVGFFVVF